MTRVDFYVLQNDDTRACQRLICKLAGKAWENDHRTWIYASSAEEAGELDSLLWTFRDISFLPHELAGEANNAATPVLIGTNDPPEDFSDIMINLAHPVPPCFSRFERVIEVVNQDEERRQLSRERFAFYRDRGYTLKTHEVDS